jgi:hypothetical protein
MLAFAEGAPTMTAEIAKIAEVMLASIEVRFIVQNYRLTIR